MLELIEPYERKNGYMTKYKYLLWDFDGTIADSRPGIVKTFIETLKSYNIQANDGDLKDVVGPPLLDSFKRLFGFDEKSAFEAVEIYRQKYKEFGLGAISLYDGVAQLLRDTMAAGYHNLIATSKLEASAERLCVRFNIDDCFDGIYGAAEDGSVLYKNEVIRHALLSLPISSLGDVLMIGDRWHDLGGAAENGIDCLGVLYGYGDIDELAKYNAVFLAKSINELRNYLI